MNFLTRRKARILLQKSADTTLSQSEQHLLQAYLQMDEGQRYHTLHQQLITWQPDMHEPPFDHHHLRQATRRIDQAVQRKRRTRHHWRVGQRLVGVTAVFALIIITIGWLQTRNQIRLEPTLSQPVVTATPPAGMMPVDLYKTDPYYYGRSVTIAEEAAGFSLHLPTWLIGDMVFKAADYYPEENSVEILTAQKKSNENWGAIWVLNQAKLSPEPVEEPLHTVFNPFSPYSYKIFDATHEEISMRGRPASYETEFWSASGGMYGYYVSRLSWETDEKRFTFTILDEKEHTDVSTIIGFLTNMRLEAAEPTQ